MRINTLLPQTVPVFSAAEVFNRRPADCPDYTYEEATLNPANVVLEDFVSQGLERRREHKLPAGTTFTPSSFCGGLPFQGIIAAIKCDGMDLILQAAGRTDVGVRSNNEDNFGYDTKAGVFVVCDGMGGQAAGERASKIAVDTLLEYFCKVPRGPIVGTAFAGVSERANSLAQAIQLANHSIHRESARNVEHAGMGSTVVALLADRNYFSIAHVGDSRIYLIRAHTIEQLTEDRSLVDEQLRRGLISQEEASRSIMENVIVRALGSEESVEPDLADMELFAGDLLLLCSDGLTRRLADGEILEIIQRENDLERACDQLIEAAKSAGSNDNITCVLVRACEPSWRDRLLGKGRQKQSSV